MNSSDPQSQRHRLQLQAVKRLTLATLFWGISFPVMKAIALAQAALLPPESNSWFMSSSAMTVRFGAAAAVVLLWTLPTLRHLTRLEMGQGLGLGLFAGLGMLFQIDGLTYTSASTSAFLTQSYCVFLPFVVAARARRWPSPTIVICSTLAVSGVAILSHVDWRQFHVGRGELETMASSMVFGAQILWLERPCFARNRVSHFTLVMFAVMTAVSLSVSLLVTHDPSDWRMMCNSTSVLALTAVLVLFCTLVAFVLMNYWQRMVPAPEAAIIYAAEPVFASLFAMVLPAWLSLGAHISYANEKPTASLLIGGGLITSANILVQARAWRESTARGKALAPLMGEQGG